MKGFPVHVIAALVAARQNVGWVASAGAHGKGAFDAERLDLMVNSGGYYELNMRGQDVADEAIRLAKSKEKPR